MLSLAKELVRRHGMLLGVGGGLAAYLALSLWRLSWPGLQYDEMLFANAALGRIDNTFIFYTVGHLPLYLMSYIGALKAWLYAPVFFAFGVSVASVRVPMILVSAAGLYLFFRLAEKIAGRTAAYLAFFLLVSNAAYLWAARVDHGPVVLGTFFEIVATYAFFAGSAPLFALACVLGLFQKIVFLFWAAGFLPVAFWLYPERRKVALSGAVASAAYLAAWRLLLGGVEKGSAIHGAIDLRVANFGTQLADLLDASAFYRNLILPHPWRFPLGIVAVLAVAVGLARLRGEPARLLRLLALQLLVSVVFTFFVGPVKSYWHFYGFLPWIYLALAIAAAAWGRVGFAVFAVFLGVNAYGQARSALAVGERTGSARYTMAIYPLIDYCRSLPDRLCASVTWGTHTQIQAFTWQGRLREPLDAPAKVPDSRFVYVDYDGLVNVSHDESQAFFRKMDEGGWKPVLLKRIYDGDAPMFEVYDFKR